MLLIYHSFRDFKQFKKQKSLGNNADETKLQTYQGAFVGV